MRLSSALGTVLLVFGLLVCGSSPARATSDPSYRTVDNQWATGWFTVVRDGWSVRVAVRLRDDKPRHCVYAKAELLVDGGPDPGPRRFGNRDADRRNNCRGAGRSTSDAVTLRPWAGYGFGTVKLWVCESNAWRDDCTTSYAAVHQNRARYPGYFDQAAGYLTEPMSGFLRHKRTRPGPFDWRDNGCTSPLGDAPGGFEFRRACKRHDFGYRNVGQGLTVRPRDATREWIDGIFRADMYRWCDGNTSGSRRDACRAAARVYYRAVRLRGGGHFF